jgi:glycosyltransferase involved in cell wall biosynthesis
MALRIGIDARFYGSIGKGLGRYTERLITHLEDIDADNQYVVFLRRENFDEYVPRNVRFRKVLADYSWYGWQEQLFFPYRLWKYRFDLVHFPHFNVPILYPRRFVVTVHDLILFHFPTARNTTLGWVGYAVKYILYHLVISLALWRAAAILTVSDFTRRDITAHYSFANRKLRVTREAADEQCFFVPEEECRDILRRYGVGEQDRYGRIRKYFLYVGNAYPHKNLEAIRDLAESFPEYLFVFVGKEDFFFRRLRSSIRDAGNICFLGFVPDRELSVLYRFAEAYLFPSRYEGFGLPGLEAMQYGLPVIASNRGSLPEVYGDAAIFFDPENPAGMLSVSRAFLSYSPKERAKLRDAGFARAGSFHWHDMAAATLAIYRAECRKQSQ